MLFTTYFNCPDCKLPFDWDRRFPVAAPRSKMIRCRVCDKDPRSLALKCLMSYLAKPDCFTKQPYGYEYNLPLIGPTCSSCYQAIPHGHGNAIYRVECGDYFCKGCIERPETFCRVCQIRPDRSLPPFKDTFLATFNSQPRFVRAKHLDKFKEELAAKEEEIKELMQKLEAIDKKEEERRGGALKGCGECGREGPVERLYKCKDCDSINCGNCCFDSHREHSVEKLLSIELDQLQKQNDKRYTETLGGLHGNLKYIQTTIDSAVDEVMEAGKDLLTNIAKCTKYDEAEVIAAKVEKAADKFEEHCEVYIPVARQLATRLTELGEELKELEKK